MPPKVSRKTDGRRATRYSVYIKDDDDITETADGHDDWPGAMRTVKPDDQLDLTDEQKNEEITRILTANNPHAPQNIVRYSYKEQRFKQIPQVDQLAVHFSMEGNLIHIESAEAKQQLMREQGIITDEKEDADKDDDESKDVTQKEEDQKEGEEKKDEAETADKVEDITVSKLSKKPANQFNYSERASQTYNNPHRTRGTVTEPPPRTTFSGSVTPWEIFDAYAEDFDRKERLKEKAAKGAHTKKEDEKKSKKISSGDSQTEELQRIAKAVKVIERMINQNTHKETADDFRYYEDEGDQYREQGGSLLPLWRFAYEKAKKLAVTALCWNPRYNDLFCVGHGSYDFSKQSRGLILCYSLKNPSYPEILFNTESGVMCLDINEQHPYLIAAGLYDGSVVVYNQTLRGDSPVYKSTAKTGKHTDPVWQIRWQKDDLDNNLNFYSVSSDGRIVCWTLVKSELHYIDIIKLRLDDGPIEGPDGTRLLTLGCGTTFDFHKQTEYMFLVGTEEGKVHKCSKAYSSQFLGTFDAHHMAVYKAAWNTFHPDIFLTCSADWTVKVWDHSYPESLFVFDLGSSVGDVCWAPFSSTVFAAVTAEGKVFVFDLSVNKYDPLCVQSVVSKKKTRCTHISFNPVFPVIIVGDDRGYVSTWKLSPNLRKMPKEKKGQDASLYKGPAFEIAKLDKILTLVRDSPNR